MPLYRPNMPFPDLARMSQQAAAIKGAGMRNRLAEMQMGAAREKMGREESLRNYLAQAAGMDQPLEMMPQVAEVGGLEAMAGLKKLYPGQDTGFKGTGMDAQAFNALMTANQLQSAGKPVPPDVAMRAKIGQQWVSRPKTVTTPEGTYERPGVDVSWMYGAPSAPPEEGAPAGATKIGTKPPTEGEKSASNFANMMIQSAPNIQNIERQGFIMGPLDYQTLIEERVPMGNYVADPTAQLYANSAKVWIGAKLRKESGAAIPPDEIASEFKRFFPVPGDSLAVVKQKARARAQAEKGMVKQAGRAWEKPTIAYTKDSPASPSSDADYQKLEKGDYFIDPDDNKLYRKK